MQTKRMMQGAVFRFRCAEAGAVMHEGSATVFCDGRGWNGTVPKCRGERKKIKKGSQRITKEKRHSVPLSRIDAAAFCGVVLELGLPSSTTYVLLSMAPLSPDEKSAEERRASLLTLQALNHSTPVVRTMQVYTYM